MSLPGLGATSDEGSQADVLPYLTSRPVRMPKQEEKNTKPLLLNSSLLYASVLFNCLGQDEKFASKSGTFPVDHHLWLLDWHLYDLPKFRKHA